MKRKIVILGSTGSIGKITLSIMSKELDKFSFELFSTNKNIKLLEKQIKKFKVKNVVVKNKSKYLILKRKFKYKNINVYNDFSKLNKIFIKGRADYTMSSITGLPGLEPTFKIIKHTKKIAIANKESIICAWNLIKKQLKTYKTDFIPVDSEHFSIWKLIKNEKPETIKKIVLTASGGPFLHKSIKKIANINPKLALKHPNWRMGKKISIDSSTMMNKIFEFIEAKKIFNLRNKDISIMIHPLSFVHAIVFFKGRLIKMLAHETNMTIPISNSLNLATDYNNSEINMLYDKLNNLVFEKPNKNDFPLLSILNLIPDRESYFEIILTTLNDELVLKYLNGKINYISIIKNIIYFIKSPYFRKFYKLKPKNLYDISRVINITKSYLFSNIKYYEK